MKKCVGVLMAVLLVSACASYTDGVGLSATDKTSAGEVSSDVAAIVDGNTAFTIDLYKELRAQKEGANLFVSPASISTAFGLAYAGAAGETKDEIARVLHFDRLEAGRFHAAMGEILPGLEVNLSGNEETLARLSINNALWVDKLTVLEEPYKALTAEHYGAADNRVDYRQNPDGARETINRWVEEKTEDRIQNLLAPQHVKDKTRAILVNTIYMNANWSSPFDGAATAEDDFLRPDGSKLKTQIMRRIEYFRHWQNRRLQVVEMPYMGDLSMVVILPKRSKGLPALEDALSKEALNGWLANLAAARPVEVDLKLPKLKLETKYEMIGEDIFPNMGMITALSDAADFSAAVRAERQPDGYPLKIGEVVHQTFLEVDEKGTEAAAATAITAVVITSGTRGPPPPPPIPFYADHPFLFLIKDNKTGMILFMGRILEPEYE